MRRRLILLLVLAALLVVVVAAVPAGAAKAPECKTIQSGLLKASDGTVITTGYDQWGYNYQALMFNGWYGNYGRPTVPVTGGDSLSMKWNDAWLSNKDCDGDFKLDRHYGVASYRGSGAWLTNHMSGDYVNDAGKACHWTYFTKIVAAPDDATLDTSSFLPGYPAALGYDGTWRAGDGTDIGPGIWGEFAIVQEVYNDACGGSHGLLYKSPFSPGFGVYQP